MLHKNFSYTVAPLANCCCLLQVLSNRETQETLLCLAFVFEVSTSEHGAQHHIYRLVKD